MGAGCTSLQIEAAHGRYGKRPSRAELLCRSPTTAAMADSSPLTGRSCILRRDGTSLASGKRQPKGEGRPQCRAWNRLVVGAPGEIGSWLGVASTIWSPLTGDVVRVPQSNSCRSPAVLQRP